MLRAPQLLDHFERCFNAQVVDTAGTAGKRALLIKKILRLITDNFNQ